jgi:membrane protein DedA with SNARE-associated domain
MFAIDSVLVNHSLSLLRCESWFVYKFVELYFGCANWKVGKSELAGFYELLGVLLTSFLLNIIPFTGPSNLLIASNAALLVNSDPFTIGFLVALGSASAKFIHYMVTFFIRNLIGEERRKRIDRQGLKLKRWAAVTLFVVAVTPLPDEPVIIPLGLSKYNPAKFYLAYFSGKLVITILGAYLGVLSENLLAPWISQQVLMVASIVLTIAVTIILFKVDVEKIGERVFRKAHSKT